MISRGPRPLAAYVSTFARERGPDRDFLDRWHRTTFLRFIARVWGVKTQFASYSPYSALAVMKLAHAASPLRAAQASTASK